MPSRSVVKSTFDSFQIANGLCWFAAFLGWIGCLQTCAYTQQLNLNPPNQLLPAPIQRPSTQTAQPTQIPVDGSSSTHPPTFRAAPAAFRTAAQPQSPVSNSQIPQPGMAIPTAPTSVMAPQIQSTVVPLSPPVSGVNSPVIDATSMTSDAILTLIQQLQAATDIDAPLKQSLTATYEAVLAEFKSRTESEKLTKEFLVAIEAAPAATTEAKRRKESPAPKRVYSDGSLDFTSLETLQSYQLELQGLAQAAIDGRARVDAAIVSREARRRDIPRLIAEDKALTAKLNEELSLPISEGVDPRVREANSLLLRSKLLAVNERIRRLEQEQRTYDAEMELLPLRKEILTLEDKYFQTKLKEVKEELGRRRESKIADQKRMIEELEAQASPEIKSLAQKIRKRSDDWLKLAKHNSTLRLEVDAARNELKLWGDRYKIMTDKISPESSRHVTNFNSWVGLMLRKQRNELPDIGELKRKLNEYRRRSLATETLILELDDWKASSALSEDAAGDLSNQSLTIEQFANASLLEQKRYLTWIERRLVDEFRVDANNYFETLFNLAETNQSTIDQVYRYQAFIDENVLWIRSSEPINQIDFKQLWPSARWLFDLQNWRVIPGLLLQDFKNHPWGYLVGLVCFAALLMNIKQLKRRLIGYGQQAAKSSCTSFLPTAQGVCLCFLLSLPLTVLHLITGWRLLSVAEGNPFVQSVAAGLLMGARYFFPLEFVRQICRGGGIAENHFEWSPDSTRHLRKNLRWFIDLAIPAASVVAIVSQFGESKWENSLGRLAFSALMTLCAIFLWSLLNPRRGVFSDFLKNNPGGWIDRLRYVWYVGLSIGPMLLVALSLTGYHYTAVRLSMLLHTTFMTLVGLLLLSSLIRRWLLTRRRQIVVSQARQRLEEARRRDPANATVPVASLTVASAISDSVTDLSEINDQTTRLVKSTLLFAALAAVAFIWSGVLPAVGVLESIKLWTVEGGNSNERIPITLAHMLIAIPTLIMTIVAARNLPGLLEIALLQHLPLENAVRYAIASLSRYSILILGIAMTFNSIGVRWASIQWLVAALGVGLGFGLQEIFGNFVSGLILLFEQPIRVGDVITLGDTTGVVSRIRMRATTVTNFDQQELVIPNKDLITGRLLNWTLSDTTNRITIQVGISYASDPNLACSVLKSVCSKHPNVLSNPEPTAFFERFGDSTLEIIVRFFLANLENRLPTRHDLLSQIHKEFQEAGIEISYPQRDIHLRSLPIDLGKIIKDSANDQTSNIRVPLSKSA